MQQRSLYQNGLFLHAFDPIAYFLMLFSKNGHVPNVYVPIIVVPNAKKNDIKRL